VQLDDSLAEAHGSLALILVSAWDTAEAIRSARRAVALAIRERMSAQVDGVRFEVFDAPHRYVSGEETALVRWLNGGPAKPSFTPPRPYQRGVRGQPTLVQNVETLAHMALIARFGPDWYRTAGLPTDPGLALVTITGAVATPGVFELPTGTTLTRAVGSAGRATEPLRAFLVGGFFGGWVDVRDADRFELSHDASAGRPALGCGAIVALPERACGLAETARILRFLADEGAGQCGPCVFGLPAIAGGMRDLATRRDPRASSRLLRWSEQVTGRGACAHPDARMTRSALRVFDTEVRSHARGTCTGGGAHVVPVPDPRPAARMEWR